MHEIVIAADKLKQLVYDIFRSGGVNEADAAETANHLVVADLRGVESHGVQRVSIYMKRLRCGLVNPNADISIEKETSVSALVNARNGLGPVTSRKALEICMNKAKEHGICAMAVHNSNHSGVLGYYTEIAARNDLIAFATTNAPANMAPFGGKVRYFGTNPFSFAFPAGEEQPFVLDMATSVVAKGKIILAAKNKQPIPLGWAIDRHGNDTTDAEEAVKGLVLPVGGPKGYGLAFMVDIFSGILSGANWGPHIRDLYGNFEEPQNLGLFFFLMRPDLFISLEEFKRRMDQAIREVRSVEKAPGVGRIYIPGERENELKRERLQSGIPLSREVVDELIAEAKLAGIGHPFEITS